MSSNEIIVDVWGDFACFTNPTSKVERVTYDVITPSAARGILCAIYSKPIEFYYQITKIEIMKPIQHIHIKRNEFKEKTNASTLEVQYATTGKGNKGLTQRNTIFLKDVYYRIHAKMIKQPNFQGTEIQFYEQFNKRLKKGKCFYQPCLGTRECMCFFSEPNNDMQPLMDLNENMGIMVYDVFDIRKHEILDTRDKNNNAFYPSIYNVIVKNGVIDVPEFDSNEVIKVKEGFVC